MTGSLLSNPMNSKGKGIVGPRGPSVPLVTHAHSQQHTVTLASLQHGSYTLGEKGAILEGREEA